MNREIKFRGICVITGNWVYGYYYPSKGNHIIRDEKDAETIVLPKSVGQFTTLRDENTKEIYEGDIIDEFMAIRWDDKAGSFEFYWTYNGESCNGDINWGEAKEWLPTRKVLGNIHENPELLTEQS